MDSSRGSAARVGFVIFIAMALVMGAIYLVGDGGSIFVDHSVYRALFPSTTGLRPDARVYLGGVIVGKVKEIGFPNDPRLRKILVMLEVQSKYTDRIREDSATWIQSEGLLGDKTVQILMGDAAKPRLPDGAEIPTMDRSLMQDIVGQGLVSGTADLLENMIVLLKDINAGKGTLGQLLRNPELYANLNQFTRSLASTSDELAGVTRDVKDLLGAVRKQDGTLGKLIYSEEYARDITRTLQSAARLMESVQAVVEPIGKGEGTLGRLVKEDRVYQDLKEGMSRLSTAAARLDESLGTGANRSLLGRFMGDPGLGQKFERLMSSLEEGAVSLRKILAKIEAGEGSLGMLVQDPSIAGSIRDTFLGVRENNLLLSAVRRAEETGRAIRYRDERMTNRMSREEAQRPGEPGAEDSRALPATGREGEGSPQPGVNRPAQPAPRPPAGSEGSGAKGAGAAPTSPAPDKPAEPEKR